MRNNIFSAPRRTCSCSRRPATSTTSSTTICGSHAPAAGAAQFVWQNVEYAGFAAYRSGDGSGRPLAVRRSAVRRPGRRRLPSGAGSPAVKPAIRRSSPASARPTSTAPRVNGARVDIGADEPHCGNGMPDPGEQCDDGNPTDGDGCDSNCTTTGMRQRHRHRRRAMRRRQRRRRRLLLRRPASSNPPAAPAMTPTSVRTRTPATAPAPARARWRPGCLQGRAGGKSADPARRRQPLGRRSHLEAHQRRRDVARRPGRPRPAAMTTALPVRRRRRAAAPRSGGAGGQRVEDGQHHRHLPQPERRTGRHPHRQAEDRHRRQGEGDGESEGRVSRAAAALEPRPAGDRAVAQRRRHLLGRNVLDARPATATLFKARSD